MGARSTCAPRIRSASKPPTRSERSGSSSGHTSFRPTERRLTPAAGPLRRCAGEKGERKRIASLGDRSPCCSLRVVGRYGDETKSPTWRGGGCSGGDPRRPGGRGDARGRGPERYEAAASNGATRLRESQ